MPCTITGSLEGDRLMHAEERLREHQLSTQLLCSLLGYYERAYDAPCVEGFLGNVPGLPEWWAKHKAQDAKGGK